MTGITVIISTYNRSGVLRETLQGIVEADRRGLAVEVVVVDNNSSDDTPAVAAAFASSISTHYLFVAYQGKNRALNHALEATELRDVVVFTDDDVIVPSDWFQQIAEACDAFPEISVFGGRIHAAWPDGVSRPGWTDDRWVWTWGYGVHDFGDAPQEYPAGDYPFGANMWVRSAVFAAGHRYRERFGPEWTDVMGSETVFLIDLDRAGYRMLYWPAADVGHRIRPDQLDPEWIVRKADFIGRVAPYVLGPPRAEQRRRNPVLWRLGEQFALASSTVRSLFAERPGDPDTRVVRRAATAFDRAFHDESLRLHRSEA